MEFVDYYKTLGVSDTASADEIKRAYRKLARKFHPDVSKEDNAEAQFKTVSEAYETLKSTEKRQAYDELKKYGFKPGEQFQPPPDWQEQQGFSREQSNHADHGDFNEFIHNIFGGGASSGFSQHGAAAQPHTWRERNTPRDRYAKLDITLEDAFSGGNKRISLQQPEVNASQQVTMRERTLDVRIPAGVADGQQLRLKGLGDKAGNIAGDIYVEIHILPHAHYRLEGKDIILNLPVSPWEAALGAKVTVPTLSGKVNLTLPANSGNGKKMRLKGKGLPGSPAGDQHVVLQIVNPRSLDAETRRLYEELQKQSAFNPRTELE